MKKQSKSPQIRFQNFEDEWLDSTIGRHISLLNGRAYKQEELLDEGKYKVLRVGNFNTNSKWYYSNLELEENKYVNKGDLLYLWATNFGPEIWTEEKAIYHYHIWKLEFDRTEINQDYLNIWLESDKKKIQQNTNGSTMVHITKTMMEERGISLPNFNEQSAIGSLFRTLDDLLASYKDNLTNYQSLKATMLSKMFPKAGQTVPEIRLDGFEGEWKFIKLAEAILEAYQGINTASDKVEYSISGIPILQAKHITNGQINYRDTRYLDMEIYEHYISKYMPKKGEILFANIGTIGPSVLVDSDKMFLIAWNILKISIKDNYSPVFIKIILSLLDSKHIFERITTGNATKFINKDEIMDIRISVPSLEEQQAIGAYFSNLDNLIAAHQEKIMQLETLKKKLLQDMFI